MFCREHPQPVHGRAAGCSYGLGQNNVLRYVAGTVDYGLNYIRGDGVTVWLATQIQTGQDVLLTGKAPQGAALVWGQDLFPGSAGSRSQLL
jgi:hypothetical protein